MDVYIFQAALWCEECGEAIRGRLTESGNAPGDAEDEGSYDSDDFPKGPFPDGGGEADTEQCCDGCGCVWHLPGHPEEVHQLVPRKATTSHHGASL